MKLRSFRSVGANAVVTPPVGAGVSGLRLPAPDPAAAGPSPRPVPGPAPPPGPPPVLRWEYLPGSTFFLVWTQNRSDTETIGGFRTGRSFGRLFDAKADNIFLVTVSYWWNP